MKYVEVIHTQTVEINKGERRTISVEVSSCDNEAFVIRNPTYKLKYSETVEDEGVPQLLEHELTVLVEPKNSGRYVLEFRMEIASEIIIRKLTILVKS